MHIDGLFHKLSKQVSDIFGNTQGANADTVPTFINLFLQDGLTGEQKILLQKRLQSIESHGFTTVEAFNLVQQAASIELCREGLREGFCYPGDDKVASDKMLVGQIGRDIDAWMDKQNEGKE